METVIMMTQKIKKKNSKKKFTAVDLNKVSLHLRKQA